MMASGQMPLLIAIQLPPQQHEKRQHLQRRSNRMNACKAIQLRSQEHFICALPDV
jgi:hypothetical protein